MLVKILDNGTVEPITTQAHERRFQQWNQNITAGHFERVCDALNAFIDHEGQGEIVTSSWIPGADWTGTPYEPIWQAVGEDWDTARFFFGLIVWYVFMNRPETWAFGRYPKNQGDVIGLTYFRVHIPSLV